MAKPYTNPLPREYRVISVIALAVLSIGSVFYHLVERLSWLDAIYFSVMTLATVGYGDIAPKTALGKGFTIIYVLSGVGIIAAFANSLFNRAAKKRIERLKDREQKDPPLYKRKIEREG